MAVTPTTDRWVYNGDAATVAFIYDNVIYAATDLLVYLAGVLQTLTTHYTVSNVGVAGGGNVTFVTAPPTGTGNVVIVSDISPTQPAKYKPGGDFPSATHETAMDRTLRIAQQALNRWLRTLRQPHEDATGIGEIPKKADRLDKVLSFHATTGDPETDITVTAINDAATDAAAASASASAASTSETNAATSESNAAISATNAAASETNADTSATNAAASASAASTSETNAAASASAASTSETNADTSETNAAASASAASTSETNADTSETNAAASASAASTSETNADTSATNAAASASAASTSETNAATSETNADTSATNASNSASDAVVNAAGFRFNFDNSTTMADPGTGDIRFNNATVASVTALALDALAADTGNPDVSDFVVTWDDSTSSALRGTIVIRVVGTPGTFAVFSVNGAITDNTGWLEVPVAHVASNGTFSNTDNLIAHFSRTGDAGAGFGDVVGPAGATDDTLPRFDSTTGKLIQGSGVVVDDSDNMSGVADLTLTGSVDGRDVAADGTKLDGVSSGAEVNPAVVSQTDAEAGTATDERIWTAERVKQAIDALAAGGTVAKVSHVTNSAVATTTTTMPIDDTIVQKAEGGEFMTLSHTTANDTNRLLISVVFHIGHTVDDVPKVCALFVDAIGDCLGSSMLRSDTAQGRIQVVQFLVDHLPGDANAHTYRVRGGSSIGGTTTFNGINSGRLHGGKLMSSISIVEYTP